MFGSVFRFWANVKYSWRAETCLGTPTTQRSLCHPTCRTRPCSYTQRRFSAPSAATKTLTEINNSPCRAQQQQKDSGAEACSTSYTRYGTLEHVPRTCRAGSSARFAGPLLSPRAPTPASQGRASPCPSPLCVSDMPRVSDFSARSAGPLARSTTNENREGRGN